MYLRESMGHAEQLAFLVTLAHNEWVESEERGMEEYNFDSWLPFIGECALKICGVADEFRR
jgi:hypothetical protein